MGTDFFNPGISNPSLSKPSTVACACAAVSSTSGGRYFAQCPAAHCIREMSRPSVTIAAPAAVTTSYASGVARCTMEGENSYADTMHKGNEGLESDSGTHSSVPGDDPPCGNNSRDARDRHARSSDSAEVDRLPVCCAMSQYVVGESQCQIQFGS